MKALTKQDLALIFDFFNVLNLGEVTGVQSADTAQFGFATSHQSPFRMQLGLSYNYN